MMLIDYLHSKNTHNLKFVKLKFKINKSIEQKLKFSSPLPHVNGV
jgi:hypothetical protein